MKLKKLLAFGLALVMCLAKAPFNDPLVREAVS